MVRIVFAGLVLCSGVTRSARAQLVISGNVRASASPYRDYDQIFQTDQRTLVGFGSASAHADLATPVSHSVASGTIVTEPGRLGFSFAGGTRLEPVNNPKAYSDTSVAADLRYTDMLSVFSPNVGVGEWMQLTLRARTSGSAVRLLQGAHREDQTSIGATAYYQLAWSSEDERAIQWGDAYLVDGGVESELRLHVTVRNDPGQNHRLELGLRTWLNGRSYIDGTAYADLIARSSGTAALAWGGLVSAETLAGDPVEGVLLSASSGVDYNRSYADLPPLTNVPEPAAFAWIGVLLIAIPVLRRVVLYRRRAEWQRLAAALPSR